MPFRTETYHVGDELDRLDDRLDDLADATTEAEPGSSERERLVSDGAVANAHLNGLQWVAAEYGRDAEIVLGGLNKGEQAEVYDRADAAGTEVVGVGETGTDGVKSVFRTAMGLVDGPFVDADAGFERRIQVVRNDLPVELCRWIEDEVNDLTTVGGGDEGNSTPFAERLAARSGSASEHD